MCVTLENGMQRKKPTKMDRTEKPTILPKPEPIANGMQRKRPTKSDRTKKPTILPKPESIENGMQQKKPTNEGKTEKPTILPKPQSIDYKFSKKEPQDKDRTKKGIVSSKPDSTRKVITNQHLKTGIKQIAAQCQSNLLLHQLPSKEKEIANGGNIINDTILPGESLQESPLTTQTIETNTSEINKSRMIDSSVNIPSKSQEYVTLNTAEKLAVIKNSANANYSDDADRNKEIRKNIGSYPELPNKPDRCKVLRILGKMDSNMSIKSPVLTRKCQTSQCSIGTEVVEKAHEQHRNKTDGIVYDTESKVTENITNLPSVKETNGNDSIFNRTGNTTTIVSSYGSLDPKADKQGEYIRSQDQANKDATNLSPLPAQIKMMPEQTNDISMLCPSVKRPSGIGNIRENVKENIKHLVPVQDIKDTGSLITNAGITPIVSNFVNHDSEEIRNDGNDMCSQDQANKDAINPPQLQPWIKMMPEKTNEISLLYPSVKRQSEIKDTGKTITQSRVNLAPAEDIEMCSQDHVNKGATDPQPQIKMMPEKTNEISLLYSSVKRQSEIEDTGKSVIQNILNLPPTEKLKNTGTCINSTCITPIDSSDYETFGPEIPKLATKMCSQEEVNNGTIEQPSLPPLLSDETNEICSKSAKRQNEIEEDTYKKGIENMLSLSLVAEKKDNVNQRFGQVSGLPSVIVFDSNTDTNKANEHPTIVSTLHATKRQPQINGSDFVETILYDRKKLNRHLNCQDEDKFDVPIQSEKSMKTSVDTFDTDDKPKESLADVDRDSMIKNTRTLRNDRNSNIPLQALTQNNVTEQQSEQPFGWDSNFVPVSSDRTEDVHEARIVCMAKFDYTPNDDCDLELVKGSVYEILDQTYGHWWKAKNKFGAIGYIPSNYVSTRSDLGPDRLAWLMTSTVVAVSVNNTTPSANVNRDSMIKNTRTLRNEREFHIPLSWHTPIQNNVTEQQSEQPYGSDSDVVPISSDRIGDVHEAKILCMAKFDFTPTADSDLELVKGSIYEILDQTYEHWWKAKNKFGASGYIPSNYVSTRSELAMYRGKVSNYRIQNNTGRFYLRKDTQFDTIPELVKYQKHTSSGITSSGIKILLTSPPPLKYKLNPHMIVVHAVSNRWNIDKSDVEIGEHIGLGSFGHICKGTLRGSKVSIETVPSTQLSHTELSNEFAIMSRISHPNLLHLYGVVSDSDPMLKVTEFIQYGNLVTYLRQHKLGLLNKFDVLMNMYLQVCSGMEYLHSRGYIHGCLAARSCRVGTNRTVKISDLSGAGYIGGGQCVSFSKRFVKWASPEVLRTGAGDKKADVWSFGVLMWEIFTCGKEPYAQMTNQEYRRYIVTPGDRLPKPTACPLLIYTIMTACWDEEPLKRPTFRDLLSCCSTMCEAGSIEKFAEALEQYQQESLSLSELGLDPREMHLFMLALNEGEENDNFIRVMVVGNFSQGKTSLTRRLLSLDLDNIDSTDGIDIHSANCGIDDMIWAKQDIHKTDESGAHRLANVVKFQESTKVEDDTSAAKEETLKTELTTTSQHNYDISFVPGSNSHDENNTNQPNEQSNTREKTEIVSEKTNLPSETDTSSDSSDSESARTDSSEEPETPMEVQSDTNVSTSIKDINLLAGFSQKLREQKETYSDDNDQSIHVNIWDFGGQFVYYATHQIFHSRDAIYLLVFDLTKELDSIVDDVDFPDRKTVMKESLRFWVSSVHAFVGSEDGQEPKIILIGTHKSACSNTEIEQRFDDVLDLFSKTKARNHIYKKPFAVENTDPNDASFTEIKNAIYDIGLEKAQNTKVPAKWIQLEVALKEVRQMKILKFEDIVNIDASTDYPIQDQKQLKVFLKYHHAKGSLVYFDEKYLCDYVIIDPQFLVDAFKCIITSKRFCKWRSDLHCLWEKLQETAILEKQLISGIWESEKTNHFSEHKDVLIAFLQKHRIISEILNIDEMTGEQNGLGKYVVPSLLKADSDDMVLARAVEGKESFCSKIVLGLSFVDTVVLKTVFERVTAAALGRWSPLEVDGKNLIFLNDAFFRIDLQHAGRIAMKDEKGIELMIISQCPPVAVSGVVCDRFRRYIETAISYEFQKLNSERRGKPFVYYIKCNHGDHMCRGSRNSHDNLDSIRKKYRICCPDNAGHSVIVKDAISEWFQGEKVTNPEEVPKRKVTEKDLSGVAQAIAGNWELLGISLGLGAVEIEQIKMDHRFTKTAIYYMLLSWKKQYPTRDTLFDLIKVMNKCEALTVDWDKIKNILDDF